MKKFFVRKIFPYDPTLGGKYSKYEGYSLITLRKISPGIKETLEVRLKNISSPVFTSNLKRAKETAKAVSEKKGLDYLALKELNEILFDLTKLVTKDEYEKYGSNLVRKRFIQAFIKDELSESRESIKKRIERLLKKLKKLPDGNYLLISHSFFMKILQIYTEDEKLFLKPGILAKKFDYRKKTFEHGKGFSFYLTKELN